MKASALPVLLSERMICVAMPVGLCRQARVAKAADPIAISRGVSGPAPPTASQASMVAGTKSQRSKVSAPPTRSRNCVR